MLCALLSLSLSCAVSAPTLQQIPEDGRGEGIFTAAWHRGRRAALMDAVGDGVIVLRGVSVEEDYRPQRQDNNFWYLTGVTTPDAVLVLIPEERREVLLLPHVDPGSERWLGNLIDPKEAQAITGIGDCRFLGEKGATPWSPTDWSGVDDLLSSLSTRYDTFYTQLAPAENWEESRDNLQNAARHRARDPYDGRPTRNRQFRKKLEESLGVEFSDLTPFMDALRQVKTPEEIQAMRRACEISGRAHVAVMRHARAGDYEWQLAARMTGSMLEDGAMGPAYAAIVGSGPNSCILHYDTNQRMLAEGDVVMIDYACEFNHYCADISRTWPVSGHFDGRQREVYEAVLAAQEAAFAECKPGSDLGRVHAAAARELGKRGFGKAFWHGTSHWIGMSTHDVGEMSRAFVPGMVFTVEPGVYLPKERIGVRVEDIVVITEDGHEILSASIPRKLAEIEKLRP